MQISRMIEISCSYKTFNFLSILCLKSVKKAGHLRVTVKRFQIVVLFWLNFSMMNEDLSICMK